MISIAHRFRFSAGSDFLIGQTHYLWHTPPIWWWYYQISLSSSMVALTSWIRASAIVAALRLGQNSFESGFRLVSFCSFPSLGGTSQWNFKEYNSLICWTRKFVPTCIWTALTTSFFPVDNWVSYKYSNDLYYLIHHWS